MRTAWLGTALSLCSMLLASAGQAAEVEKLWSSATAIAHDQLPRATRAVGALAERSSKPVIATVAAAVAEVKVKRLHRHLLTDAQIDTVVRQMEPGDIILERTDGYLSNAFITGFWGHVIFNLGSFDEAVRYFDDDQIRGYLAERGFRDFAEFVTVQRPAAAAVWRAGTVAPAQPIRMIEADGVVGRVVLYPAGEALASDNVAVLRPHALSRLDKMLALVDALAYLGVPYDMDFDTRTDSALVCTELIARAYAGNLHKRGLRFDVDQLTGGRTMIYPNRIAEMYQRERTQPGHQLDFVTFVTAADDTQAVVTDEAAFLSSAGWQRLL